MNQDAVYWEATNTRVLLERKRKVEGGRRGRRSDCVTEAPWAMLRSLSFLLFLMGAIKGF